MDNYNINSEGDFLDELTPLSAALVDIPTQPPSAYTDLPIGSFMNISSTTCFKRFEIRFLNGVGDANISRTLGQIRELSIFKDLCTIFWDCSDITSFDNKKRNFFFGRQQNLQIALYYCILSDMDMKDTTGEFTISTKNFFR